MAPLLFSHPAGKDRSKGVVLRSTDGAQSWTKVADATPKNHDKKFGYSSLTLLEHVHATTMDKFGDTATETMSTTTTTTTTMVDKYYMGANCEYMGNPYTDLHTYD